MCLRANNKSNNYISYNDEPQSTEKLFGHGIASGIYSKKLPLFKTICFSRTDKWTLTPNSLLTLSSSSDPH